MTGKKKRHPVRALLILLALAAVWALFGQNAADRILGAYRVQQMGEAAIPGWVDVQLIDMDGTSRSGVKLEDVQDIVIHYVGNPGTSAQQNHDYYCNPESAVSSHFIVGLDGEIIQCVPLDEKSAASNWRNRDTISIEVCHPDETGRFNDSTYASLVKLTAWLLETGGLEADNLIRHYDITGKQCPLYFVDNPDSWETFKQDVARAAQ